MAVKDVNTLDEFQSHLASSPAAVAYFWATWCEPCRQMDLVFAQLASESPDQNFLRIEAEEVSDVTEKYGVASVPYFVFLQNGSVVDTLEGANPPELAHKVSRHVASKSSSRTVEGPFPSASGASAAPTVLESVLNSARAHPSSTESHASLAGHASANGNSNSAHHSETVDLNTKLKNLVHSNSVMVFMKGTPEEPRCGFSAKVVNALKTLDVKFGSFDILSDEEVRQGMKKYADWPTFPQVYHKGELIGGCDIILEMHRSGELQKLLQDETEASDDKKASKSTLDDRLRKLVRSSDIMLFMKGTPSEPRCGFSRKVVAALHETGVKFGSFDILSDEEVRQGLKEYSNWPTYPQLYHKGELVGGCDIVLEMHSTGELAQALS